MNTTVLVDKTVQVIELDSGDLEVVSVGIQGPPGVGILAGGTTGQVLEKASNADYDMAWVAVPGSAPGGSARQVQYASATATFAGAPGFEYQAGASPNVLMAAQNAAHVPTVVRAALGQSANMQEWQDSTTLVKSGVNASGQLFGDGSLLTNLPVNASTQATWRFATSTVMADPTANRFRFNAATIPAVTAIAFSKTTSTGIDFTTYLQTLIDGDGLYIQNKAVSSSWVRFIVNGPVVNNTTWFQVPVALQEPTSYGGAAPTNNTDCLVDITRTVVTSNVTTFNGREGDIILLTADVTGVGGVVTSRQVLAGSGLAGGGTLAADVTLSLPGVGTAGTYGSASLAPIITTDAQGRVSAVSTAAITPATRQVLAGAGLSGGGALSADVTLSMPNVGTAGTYGSASLIPIITTDAQGRVSAVSTAAVSSGTLDHALLTHLDYASSGHTGFTPATRQVLAGTGLSGGGALSADVTLSMPAVGTAGTYGSASLVPIITTDSRGRVTAVSTATIGSGVTDHALLSNLSYTTSGHTGFVPDTRQVIAGTGLSGGGALSADRTLSMPSVGTAGTYGSSSLVPVITTDAQGRVSAVSTAAVSGGGGGTPGGSTKQIQYNNASAFAGAAGFEYQAGASPNVLIVAQNATYVPLVTRGAASQTANLQEWQDSSGTARFAIGPAGDRLFLSNTRFLHETGTENTFLGNNAGNFTLSGSQNTAVGETSLTADTSGSFNTAIGRIALASNTTGSNNTAVGSNAMYGNTTGGDCTAIGSGALSGNTTGQRNMAMGATALTANQTGNDNVAIGQNACGSGTATNANIGIGGAALYSNSADGSVGIGYTALYGASSGVENVAIGYLTGRGITTGGRNTFLGSNAGYTGTTGTINGSAAIGYNAQVTASNTMALGGTGADAVSVVIAGTSASAQFQVNAATAATKGLIVQGAASQSANLQEWQDSSSNVKGAVSPNGSLFLAGRLTAGVVALTDAATIATDASLGNTFRVTLGGNRTLGAPTNPTDGQQATWEITQGSGGQTLALDAIFAFGTDLPSVTMSTGAGKVDILAARYHSTSNRWRVTGFVKGF